MKKNSGKGLKDNLSSLFKRGTKYTPDEFPPDQWAEISFRFEFEGDDELDKLKEKWTEFMLPSIRDLWLIYSTSNNKLSRKRFHYVYTGLASSFYEEKALAMFRIITGCSPDDRPADVPLVKILQYIKVSIASYLRALGVKDNNEFSKWLMLDASTIRLKLMELISFMTRELCEASKATGIVQLQVFEDWLRSHTLLTGMMCDLASVAYGLYDVGTNPSLLPSPRGSNPTVMDVADIIFLCSRLTYAHRSKWRLRFHTTCDGQNFTMLCHKIVNVGPTLVIIKDDGGHIFGCFASESWKVAPTFYGNIRCFMFQLHPVLQIFEPSGRNSNFQYHNTHQHSLPNGFAVGGQIGTFGMWISSDFGQGSCTKFCHTFDNWVRPSISESFKFSHAEVWSVHDADDEEEEIAGPGAARRSILDSEQLARALLAMAGKPQHSNG